MKIQHGFENLETNISLDVIFLSAQSFGHACSSLPLPKIPLWSLLFLVRKYFSLF